MSNCTQRPVSETLMALITTAIIVMEKIAIDLHLNVYTYTGPLKESLL